MESGRRGALSWPLITGAVVGLLLATIVVGYRVLAPAETVDPADAPYPAPVVAEPRGYGQLSNAPLVVDRRLRVYAAERRIWADAPVDARASMTPYWAFRRWPAQVLGVVVAPGPVVVGAWSDGKLVALDARTGREAWRAEVGSTGAYNSRRTGAGVVYQPAHLFTATAADGRAVVLSSWGGTVRAFDAGSGALLWSRPRGCESRDWTVDGAYATVDCAQPTTVDLFDAGTGTARPVWRLSGGDPTPIACAVGHSDCRAVRTSTSAWLLGPGGAAVEASALAPTAAWLVGRFAVEQTTPTVITARDAVTGAPGWTWQSRDGAAATLIATEPGRIYVLVEQRTLVTVNPLDGTELSRVTPQPEIVGTGWRPAHVYARDGFVAVERVRGPENSVDSSYFSSGEPVLLLGS
ncbi:MAG TPA: PQQ-binding-like beta-propeller repeat protein [Micromonosporaceae bacterium]